jgi:PAS domain S-box-containing protein
MTADIVLKHLSRVTEAELQKLNAVLMTHCGSGILIVQAGTIVAVNHHLCRLGGYVRDEIENLTLSKLLAGFEASFDQTHKHSACFPERAAILFAKDGTRVPVRIKQTAVQLRRNHANLLLVRDDPKHDTSRAELERVRQLESIAALSGGIAHDYNNLLTAILGNISLANCHSRKYIPCPDLCTTRRYPRAPFASLI